MWSKNKEIHTKNAKHTKTKNNDYKKDFLSLNKHKKLNKHTHT